MTIQMRSKIFALLSLSVLALIMFIGAVSAATIFSDDFNDGDLVGWTVTNWSNTGTFAESTNQVNSTLERTISTSSFNTIVVKYDRRLGANWESTDNFKASWSLDGITFTTLEAANSSNDAAFVSKTFNLPSSANNNSGFRIRFECTTSAADEFCRVDNVVIEGAPISTTPLEIQSCTSNPGELRVRKISFTNNGQFGEKDKWFPFEEIKVEIQTENNGDYDVADISLEWGLYNTKSNEWVVDFDEEDEFDLDEGDRENFIVSFKLDDNLEVDLDELDDGQHYRLYVMITGTIDDKNSPNDGDKTCAFDYKEAEIIIEKDFVILDEINIQETVQCGENVQLTAEVWNIGDRDQDDVYVLVNSNELGINNKKIEIGDISAFDSEPMNLIFTIPKDAQEKTYSIKLTVYDEDNDIYENDDDKQSIFSVFLKVEGNCVVQPDVLVSASLESDAKAGEDLVIRVVLTNTGSTAKTFTLDVSGHETWAEVLEYPETILINAGDFEEAYIKFNVNKGVSGTNTFSIRVYSDSQLLATQPFSVNIEPKGFLGITGFPVLEGDAYLWGFGILNIILVVVIILVAIRIARKKK